MSRSEFVDRMAAEYNDKEIVMIGNVLIETPEGTRYPLYSVPGWLAQHVTDKHEVSNGKPVYSVDIAD